jgi:hypothetical protein
MRVGVRIVSFRLEHRRNFSHFFHSAESTFKTEKRSRAFCACCNVFWSRISVINRVSRILNWLKIPPRSSDYTVDIAVLSVGRESWVNLTENIYQAPSLFVFCSRAPINCIIVCVDRLFVSGMGWKIICERNGLKDYCERNGLKDYLWAEWAERLLVSDNFSGIYGVSNVLIHALLKLIVI